MDRAINDLRENSANNARQEILEEMDSNNRFTPVALTLAVSTTEETSSTPADAGRLEAMEEAKATILEAADDEYNGQGESQWTPVALRLARANGTGK